MNNLQQQHSFEEKKQKNQTIKKKTVQSSTLNARQNNQGTNKQESITEYDPEMRPFSIRLADLHSKATKVYKKEIDNPEQENLICPCCQKYEGQQLPILAEFNEFSHLGPTYPLFFQFVLFGMGILLIIIGISSIYMLITNSQDNQCEITHYCHYSLAIELSTSNRSLESPDDNVAYLNLSCCILLMIFVLFYRRRQKTIENLVDQSDISVSDYTLMVSNIPKGISEQEIKDFFQGLSAQLKINIKVMKINPSFKIGTYQSLIQYGHTLFNNIFQLHNFNVEQKLIQFNPLQQKQNNARTETSIKNSDQEQLLTQQLKEIEIKIETFEKECLDFSKSPHFSGICFISFQTEAEVIKLLAYFHKSILQQIYPDKNKLFKGKSLTVIRGPEPGDINWKNLGTTTKEKYIRRGISFIITIGMLMGCFFAILELTNFQEELRKQQGTSKTNQGIIWVMSMFSSFIVILINMFLATIIRMLADIEIYNTPTDFYVSIAMKLTFAQFINTAIISLIVNIISNGRSFDTDGGLISDVSLIIISNAIVPAIFEYISIEQQVKNLKIWYYRRYPSKRMNLSQEEANRLFELSKMNPALKFATVIKTLMFSAFYSYIIPFASIISLGALVIQYYLIKYMLLRQQSSPPPLSCRLPERMVDIYVELIILSFSTGCFVFELLIFGEPHAATIAQFTVAFLYFVLPMDLIFSKLIQQGESEEAITYEEAKRQKQFTNDYDRENPITKNHANKSYLMFQIENEQDKKKKDFLQKLYNTQAGTLPNHFKLSQLSFDPNLLRDQLQQNIQSQNETKDKQQQQQQLQQQQQQKPEENKNSISNTNKQASDSSPLIQQNKEQQHEIQIDQIPIKQNAQKQKLPPLEMKQKKNNTNILKGNQEEQIPTYQIKISSKNQQQEQEKQEVVSKDTKDDASVFNQ